ncbi:hypothetical protein [Natrononativus amylolyticus]|uniref:hypothetical protein n=1 Tax=Natrononativus amylolyticus TaxID=2963434 RepID=UPI0020CBB48A|nr:hypothetical protein [Natrononativus amylolyticus]
MDGTIALAYFGGLFALFFFWLYGIVSFVFDLKNRIVPGLVQYRRGRKRLAEKENREQERTEEERQLY